MAFIECKKHGGHLASLVSHQVADFLDEKKDLTDIQIREIDYVDDNKSKSYFMVDAKSFLKLSEAYDIDLSNPIESEELAYGVSLELDVVCPLCLGEWLKKN
tara:strand:- start:327 stop:632 length:306 start_codon:yes stop_codon:yes gene_type:complete